MAFSNEIYKLHPDDHKAKRIELTSNNKFYKKLSEKRSSKKWHYLKKENGTSPKEIVDKLATTLANSSGITKYAEAVRKFTYQTYHCR